MRKFFLYSTTIVLSVATYVLYDLGNQGPFKRWFDAQQDSAIDAMMEIFSIDDHSAGRRKTPPELAALKEQGLKLRETRWSLLETQWLRSERALKIVDDAARRAHVRVAA